MAKRKIELTDELVKLTRGLTQLQYLTVINIVRNGMSNRQAYIKAGGKANGEKSQDAATSQLLRSVKVTAFKDALMESVTKDAILSREEALEILSDNARIKMHDVATFNKVQVGENEAGEPMYQSIWVIKDSADIDEKALAQIKSVTATSTGLKIELHDRNDAIKQIRTMEGWDSPKKTEVTGANGEPVAINSNVSSPEVVAAMAKILDKL